MTVVTARPTAREATRGGRLVAALPLAVVFVCLTGLYVWQGRRLVTPWTFYDELYYTRLARSLVGDESLNLRLDGVGPRFTTLYAVLIAPAWLFDNAETAYRTIKLAGAVVMTAALFPVHALARTLVSPPFALFAATGAVAIPALSYSSQVMEEPIAYPYAALCFLLMANALATRRRAWVGPAVVACAAAPFIRHELAVLPIAFAVAAGLFALTSEEGRARWSSSPLGLRVAGLAVAVGLVVMTGWASTHISVEWSTALDRRGTALRHAMNAAGGLTVGVGFLPAIAGLALLASPRLLHEPRRRAFACIFGTSLVGFLLYTGIKTGFLSAEGHAHAITERNLIYLAPLLFVASAMWFESGGASLAAIVVAGALVAGAVVAMPLAFPGFPASDAPSFAIVAGAHDWGWTAGALRGALLGAVALSTLVLAALPLVRRRPGPLGGAVLAAVCAAIIGWGLTAEFYAASSGADFARRTVKTVPRPFDWLDATTRGGQAVYIGRKIQRSEVLALSFWNRSLIGLFTLDHPPGEFTRASTNGATVLPIPTRAEYVVADHGVVPVGKPLLRRGTWTLYAIDPPVRLASAVVGVYPDGWTGPAARYERFRSSTPGTLTVSFSRGTWCGPTTRPATFRVAITTLRRPAVVLRSATRELRRCGQKTIRLDTPAEPFRAALTASSTFVPKVDQPPSEDTRRLGALVELSYRPRPA